MHNMYSILDKMAKAYTQPFPAPNDGVAIRMFQDTINAADSVIAKHPEQYTLYRVGHWNDTKGELTPEPNGPEIVQTALSLWIEQGPSQEKLNDRLENLINALEDKFL